MEKIMLTLRKAGDRGRTNFGWLDSWHTFSFGDYIDRNHVQFHSLRVINDDRIAPGGGFPTHPHRDMEIVTIMLAGRLAHRDSLGSVRELTAGEVQAMTAGTGIAHSEFNPSDTEPAHLLQVWLLPKRRGLEPGYDQKRIERKPDVWTPLASPDGRDGSLVIHQDAQILSTALKPGERLTHDLAAGRGAWVHVATGSAIVNGTRLDAGDAAAMEKPGRITVEGVEPGEVLLFDLK